MAIRLQLQTAMAASLANTSLHLQHIGARNAFRQAEAFISALEAHVEERGHNFLKATLVLPRGLWTVIKIRCHAFSETTLGDVMEWRHHSGNQQMYELIFQAFEHFLVNAASQAPAQSTFERMHHIKLDCETVIRGQKRKRE